MRAGITFAALVAAASAEVVVVTKLDISTVTVVVPPGGGPAPTQHAAPAPASKQESEHVQVQQAPQSAPQKAPQSAPQPQSNPMGAISAVVDGVYQSAVLSAHNSKRAVHGAQGLQWSDDLATIASQQAVNCQWGHFTNMDGQSYGQNIAAGVSGDQISNVITGLFYNNEEPAFAPYYGNPNPPNFEAWGHFTQVVWKETTHVGCYTHSCSDKGGLLGMSLPGMVPYYTVCNYSPAGNMAGQYAAQVGAPH